ncbi:MAG: hypothetical protein ACXVBI_11235 [Flavisolibacter sp.]
MSEPLRNKLLDYAAPPPEKVWENLADALGTDASGFGTRMYQFEASPSPAVWKAIQDRLSPLVDLRQQPRRRRAWRYAAAAAVLAVLVFSATLFPGKRIHPSMATPSALLPTQPVRSASRRLLRNEISASASLSLEETPENRSHAVASVTGPRRNTLSRLLPRPPLEELVHTGNFLPECATEKQTISNEEPVEKYMVYSDEQGHVMRLPKKLFDFISCVRENAFCQQQLKALQEKLAVTDFSNDFTGVLDLLNHLKENQ